MDGENEFNIIILWELIMYKYLYVREDDFYLLWCINWKQNQNKTKHKRTEKDMREEDEGQNIS